MLGAGFGFLLAFISSILLLRPAPPVDTEHGACGRLAAGAAFCNCGCVAAFASFFVLVEVD